MSTERVGSAGRQTVRLGVTLPQFTADPSKFQNGVRRAEDLGLDSIWVFDHLWPLSGGKERPVLECWSALAWAAGATERIRVGTLVTRSTLRNTALLARMAETVEEIGPGRLTVAIGSGDEASRDENEAFGIPYLGGDARIEQLEETVRQMQGITSPIWVAGRSDDAIDIAARLADGWNGWGGSVKRFSSDVARLRTRAGERDIAVTWAGIAKHGVEDLVLAERISDYVTAGAEEVILSFPNAGDPGVYESLAGPVRSAL